jgi:uncharacterized protein (DUF1684 family)
MEITNKIEAERKEKDSFFKMHPQSPIPYEKRNDFTALNYYPIKPEFRFILELREHKDKERIEVEDNKGNKQEFLRWEEFRFEVDGKQIILQAYKANPNEERLWVPFRDSTNEKETYGAGRYIDLESSRDKEDDKWILDFNLAYNPFCAYSENYVCPFIPPENWLPVKVEAGEKKYR